jgi:very-short-patch-repair endonuclease
LLTLPVSKSHAPYPETAGLENAAERVRGRLPTHPVRHLRETKALVSVSAPDLNRIGISMKINLLHILCKECRRKVKAAKRGEKARTKLLTHKDATYQQKQGWKTNIATAMRLNPTPAEKYLRDQMLAVERAHGWNLSFQKQIGPYIADCCITNRKVVVEVDGIVHEKQKNYDNSRDCFIRSRGFDVMRFTNEEVTKNWPHVLDQIVRVASV